MADGIWALSRNLDGWCTFIDGSHHLLLIAPQKCGSTSIFKSLYDKLVDPNLKYERIFSHEYTKDLCIHRHLKLNQDCSAANLKKIFSDQEFKKILVTRDPIDRLCSAICSKYLIENSPHYQSEIKNKGHDEEGLSQPYLSSEDFLYDFNKIAHILLTKGSIYGNQRSSHAAPISELIPREITPFFNEIIDITKKEGWTKLKNSLNQHLQQYSDHPVIESFPHVNENPLSNSKRFLSNQNLTIAFGRYEDDYRNFHGELPERDEHEQIAPGQEELKALNTFLSLAGRSIDLFNIGNEILEEKSEDNSKQLEITHESHEKELNEIINSSQQRLELTKTQLENQLRKNSETHAQELIELKTKHNQDLSELKTKHTQDLSELTIKSEQLIYLEELSRRTAEKLLIESHDLMILNEKLDQSNQKLNSELNSCHSLKESPNTELQKYFPFYDDTKELDPATLARRAEKRIKNKNFRSAQELLIQAYCMNKRNHQFLIRAYSASIQNPLFRSILIFITSPTLLRNTKHNGGNQ